MTQNVFHIANLQAQQIDNVLQKPSHVYTLGVFSIAVCMCVSKCACLCTRVHTHKKSYSLFQSQVELLSVSAHMHNEMYICVVYQTNHVL